MSDTYRDFLLSDEQVAEFVVKGYMVLKPDLPEGFNEYVYDECEKATAESNPGNEILEMVPKLHDVWSHPEVKGAFVSLLGEDYTMNAHRHCHVNHPGTRSQGWHQDGVNQRHHEVRVCLGFYYPQDVPHELGPTVLVPGTHFRNAPTDRMATYANFRDQVNLVCEAGTVAITHYDIWHAAARNCGDKTRYMLKFLFNRQSEPTAPSWNHDPANLGKANGVLGGRATINGQSDHYAERRLRREMWDHLMGKAAS